MKRLLQICTIVLVVVALATPALAASSRRGKRVFKKNCKTCHIRKSPAGKLSPLMKTQSQWRIYFEENQHKDNPEIWEGMKAKQKQNLLKFFLDFAIDSDQPETCG